MPRLRAVAATAHLLLAASAVSAQTSPAAPARAWDEKLIALPNVGSGTAYVPHAPAQHVVILISGDAGWDDGARTIARQIAAEQAGVIGIAYPALRRGAAREGGCWYVAAALELIPHSAQKTLKLPQYHPPLLVG